MALSTRAGAAAARRTLLALAIIATLTGDFALAAAPGRFPEWPALALVGIALGQVILAAAWLALGSSHGLARSTALPLTAMALAQLVAPKVDPSATEIMGVLLAVGAAVAVLLAGARLAGRRITATAGAVAILPLASRRYSLASLFALTTVVAVYAAIVREVSFPAEQWFLAALHCIGFVAAALVPLAVFACGMRGDWRVWLAAAVALGAACGAVAGPMGRIAAFEAAFLFVASCVLLDCGYRIFSPAAARADPST
jgi:hypothetical protein